MASRTLGIITVRSGKWSCCVWEIRSLPEDTIHRLLLSFHDPVGGGRMRVEVPPDCADFSDRALEDWAADVTERHVVGDDGRPWSCRPSSAHHPDGVNRIVIHGEMWRGVAPIPAGFRLPNTPEQLKLGELTHDELLETIMLAYDR